MSMPTCPSCGLVQAIANLLVEMPTGFIRHSGQAAISSAAHLRKYSGILQSVGRLFFAICVQSFGIGVRHASVRARQGGNTLDDDGPFGVEEIARLLRLLGSNPTPDAVVRAAVHGFLAPFVVHRSSLHRRSTQDGLIYTLAAYGLSTAANRRFAAMDPSLELPVVEAMQTNQILFIPGSEIPDRYPLLRADFAADPVLIQANSMAVFVPIVLHGEPSAVLGFSCIGYLLQDRRYLVALEALAAALSLWLQQGDHGDPGGSAATEIDGGSPLSLTERQHAILLGVERGLTNAEIAAELDCSRSTVKQELQRVMFSLAATSREQVVARARESGLFEPAPN